MFNWKLAGAFVLLLIGSVCSSLDLKSASRISRSQVTVKTYSESDSAPQSLFGNARTLQETSANLLPGVHPRIVFNSDDWDDITTKYAQSKTSSGTWSKYFMDFTIGKGPHLSQLQQWAVLDTSAYTGSAAYNNDDTALKTLADELLKMDEYHEQALFMMALHVDVNEKYIAQTGSGYLNSGVDSGMAISVIVNWAKIVLSHYAVYGCDTCDYVDDSSNRYRYSDLWDTTRRWELNQGWNTGNLGLALSYDVLYDRMTVDQRRTVRSAIGMIVKGRQHWGMTDTSTRDSPNCIIHPHRCISNWAIYHANLYMANLAIEGETDFDGMTSAAGVSFSNDINTKFIAIFDAFVSHAIYPAGSSYEDGYTVGLAFREGSLGGIALARRGYNHYNTNRFRNFILNCAQMMEPYQCGDFIGHSSGGGELYPAFYGLIRYVYPNGELPNMLWRQRMSGTFSGTTCRISWHQTDMQLAILGGEHGTTAESPATLSGTSQAHFEESVYYLRRGLLVARSSLAEDALYVHFDARPDVFYLGHDNADRGGITMSALSRTWLDDMPWRDHLTSQDHSLMHIDNQAQALKAPSVEMLKVQEFGDYVIAAADLSRAYNVQWARAWSTASQPTHDEIVYTNGIASIERITYTDIVSGHPTSYGWPTDDDGADLGFTPTTSMWGEPDLGFMGFYTWQRQYRTVLLERAVRSVVVMRDHGSSSYFLVGDNFKMEGSGLHTFDSYFILAEGVYVSTGSCTGNTCDITLNGGNGKFMNVLSASLGSNVDYRTESVDSQSRLILRSSSRNIEKFCVLFYPGTKVDLTLSNTGSDCTIDVGSDKKVFAFSSSDHSLSIADPSPSPSASTSPSETPSSTPSVTPSASSSTTPSPTISASASASPSLSSEPSTTVSPTPSVSLSETTSPSPTVSPSSGASISPSQSLAVTPSSSPFVDSTPASSSTPSPSTDSGTTAPTPSATSSEEPNSASPSPSKSAKASSSPSKSSKPSKSPSPSASTTPSPSMSTSPTPSISVSPSVSPTPSVTPSPSPFSIEGCARQIFDQGGRGQIRRAMRRCTPPGMGRRDRRELRRKLRRIRREFTRTVMSDPQSGIESIMDELMPGFFN